MEKKVEKKVAPEAVVADGLTARLNRVRSGLKVKKSRYNAFGKFYYRNCEDILEAIKAPLAEEGLLLVASDDIVQIGDRYYVKATVTITYRDGKNYVTSVGYAREAAEKKGMDCAMLTGATSSYAKKYALNALFLLDDNQDADANGSSNTAKPPAKRPVSATKPPPAKESANPFKNMLVKFQNAKKALGEEDYYTILRVEGYTKSNEIGKVVEGNRILVKMGKHLEDMKHLGGK